MSGRGFRGGPVRFAVLAAAVVALAASAAWALGLELGETKEQLKLDYSVNATDHGTGRVTVNLAIADEGRLKPLTAVELLIRPEKETGVVDLSIPVALRQEDGKGVARVHLKRELAERAELQLRTDTLDGKQLARTWWYHRIPLAKYL